MRTAMMAMTTSNSMSVKPVRRTTAVTPMGVSKTASSPAAGHRTDAVPRNPPRVKSTWYLLTGHADMIVRLTSGKWGYLAATAQERGSLDLSSMPNCSRNDRAQASRSSDLATTGHDDGSRFRRPTRRDAVRRPGFTISRYGKGRPR